MRRILTIGALGMTAFLALAAPPDGWVLTGSKPANYESGIDMVIVYNSRPSAFLKSKADSEGFGTLAQSFSADQYRGKRVRLSAWVKAEMVSRWAGLWMRVDGPIQGSAPLILGFDNMQNRPIKGSQPWRKYEVILDVPEAANLIAMGILQDGPGQVWLSSVEFTVVGKEAATTSSRTPAPDSPRNLSLDR